MSHTSLFGYSLDECFLRSANLVPFGSVLEQPYTEGDQNF